MRYFITGGTKIRPEDVSSMNLSIPNGQVVQFYSLTEFGIIASNFMEPKKDSVGFLRNGVQCKIVDEDGKRLGISEDGEICVKGPTKLLTDLNDVDLCDNEGFLRTGDIGHFDEYGNLYVIDRIKDIFKCYDEYIYPSEIEDVIKTHPAIENVCIVSVPDKIASDLTAAVIVKREGFDISEKDIYDLVKG